MQCFSVIEAMQKGKFGLEACLSLSEPVVIRKGLVKLDKPIFDYLKRFKSDRSDLKRYSLYLTHPLPSFSKRSI